MWAKDFMSFIQTLGLKMMPDSRSLAADSLLEQTQLERPMDPTLLCTDNQTRPAPALTDSPVGDLGSLPALDSPTENTPSAYETEGEAVSELSDATDKLTEALSNVSQSLSQGKSSDSDCLKPLPSSYNKSKCLSFCLESSAPKDDECYFGPSDHVIPLLTRDLTSRQSESDFYFKEPAITLSLIQENRALQPFLSSTTEGLMEPGSPSCSSIDPVSSLLRSISHQPDGFKSDTTTAPLSDLYIFESETQDFILSHNVDPEETKGPKCQPLSQTEEGKADPEYSAHDSMGESENVVKRCHRAKERAMPDYESGMSQHRTLRPSAVDACAVGSMSVNDAQRRNAEVTDLTPHLKCSNSSIELWLDACQFLSDEDTENRGGLGNRGHCVTQGGLPATRDLSFPTTETLVSGYNPDGGERIGWSDDDSIGWGPPVERWSSVDSWASALSNWTGIIASPPEDLTAAFTEIGAEIDALTQALAEVSTRIETSKGGEGQEAAVQVKLQPPMGVQDHHLKAHNIPESAVLSGQRCLSLCLEAAREEGSERVESLCDTTTSTQREEDPEEVQSSHAGLSSCPAHHCTSMGSSGTTGVSPGGGDGELIPGSTSSNDLDLSHFGGYVESFATDIFISTEEDPIILTIIEDADLEGQNAPTGPAIEEPFAGGLCEVTDEHNRPDSQPGSAAKQEAKSSFVPAVRGGTKSSTDHPLASHLLTDSHMPSVDKQPGHNTKVQSVGQLQPQSGRTKFIVPLAPVGVGSPSLVRQTNRRFRGDQSRVKRSPNDHVEPCIPWPTTDEITVKRSLENNKELIDKKKNTIYSHKSSPQSQPSSDTTGCFFTERKTVIQDIHDLRREQSNSTVVPSGSFFISETSRVAVITLDLNDPFVSNAVKPTAIAVKSKKADLNKGTAGKMPHKTHKSTSEGRARSKKEKSAGHHHSAQAPKKQENLCHLVSAQPVYNEQESHPLTDENQTSENITAGPEDTGAKLVIDTVEETENVPTKPHGKKKKKHAQSATGVKTVVEPLVEAEKGAKPKATKGRIDMFEAKLGVKAGNAQKDSGHPHVAGTTSQIPTEKGSQGEPPPQHTANQPKSITSQSNDDIKRRRLSEDKFRKMFGVFESKLPKPDVPIQSKVEEAKVDVGATPKKAYSDAVKQRIPPKEEPKVVKSVQAEAVSGDPQSLCLWCQFSAVFSQHTVTWSRDGAVTTEIKRSAGDESRVSLMISNASHKDLGKYQCRLTSLHGSVTLDYLLTYEVLYEIVIPPCPRAVTSAPVEVGTEEEDVECSKLLFKEDFLSEQYFGETQLVSIITEKVHFGEGMHRRAFRTKLHTGQISLLLPGHSCVLKVHNSISYGTNNNDELVQKNFTLAVEECHVQNTAREYIKAYTTAAQSFESFGEIPEIIPIYLVHRRSNDIPYATLEEELIGDFVKYSVKDGKEINLMRRDSEAGQKCCAFQHWVYHKTEGNLLVTDMQGVGMRLTDVGIATSKKGYKGFKGNCATSFIDQFKALHQCNKYCEIMGLKSLQPKAKKQMCALKPKPQPSATPKKKTFGSTVKGKS